MNKIINIYIYSLSFSLLIFSPGTAHAEENSSPIPYCANFISSDTPAQTFSENFIWYTRIQQGKKQKRLWSVTEQKWLTDWIDVE